MDFDLKSLAVGSFIGLAVGGGIYGFYLKNMAEANVNQATGYRHVAKCVSLLGSSNLEEIADFLNKLPQKQKDLEESDTIATATTTVLSGELEMSGMGLPLAQCSELLLEQYERVKS
ncbi:hypothetical protein LQN35_000407 [Vibrio parahaemolyticus]|nr:hypothetical protein [Vibrio parahaemolyticus]